MTETLQVSIIYQHYDLQTVQTSRKSQYACLTYSGNKCRNKSWVIGLTQAFSQDLNIQASSAFMGFVKSVLPQNHLGGSSCETTNTQS